MRLLGLPASVPKHEIYRMHRDLPKLRLIAERAFEHGEAARHGDDV